MADHKSLEHWGRATARKRYADGGSAMPDRMQDRAKNSKEDLLETMKAKQLAPDAESNQGQGPTPDNGGPWPTPYKIGN